MQPYVETQINESASTGGAQGGRLLGTFHSVPEVTSEQPWVSSKALQDQHWKALSKKGSLQVFISIKNGFGASLDKIGH